MDGQSIVQGAGYFEQFLKHASASAIVASLLFGWGFMIATSFPIKWFVRDTRWATFYLWVICIVSSTLLAALLWPPGEKPGDWKVCVGWAATTGMLSPAIWYGLAHLVGWKWPTLAAALKLKRVSLDTENENDVRPPEPGPDAT